MKYLVSLFLLFCTYSCLTAQSEPLNPAFFVPSEGNPSGTAEVSGTMDRTTNEFILSVVWSNFEAPMNDVFIHMGSTSDIGPNLLNLNLLKDEFVISGQIGRLVIGEEIRDFTKIQSKAQETRRIDINQFQQMIDAIAADNACIVLRTRTGDLFTAPLRLASAIPTMSQWTLFILALMISSIALIHLKRRSMAI